MKSRGCRENWRKSRLSPPALPGRSGHRCCSVWPFHLQVSLCCSSPGYCPMRLIETSTYCYEAALWLELLIKAQLSRMLAPERTERLAQVPSQFRSFTLSFTKKMLLMEEDFYYRQKKIVQFRQVITFFTADWRPN